MNKYLKTSAVGHMALEKYSRFKHLRATYLLNLNGIILIV